MSLKDYFNMGRQSEIEYTRKKKARSSAIKKPVKPSPISPAGIIMGLGVFYQIILPHIGMLTRFFLSLRKVVDIIRIDAKMLLKRLCGTDKEYETYKRFDELARRGKMP